MDFDLPISLSRLRSTSLVTVTAVSGIPVVHSAGPLPDVSSYRLFLLSSILWGTAFMVMKAGVASVPPVLFAGFRDDIAGVIMLGYAAYATDNWRP